MKQYKQKQKGFGGSWYELLFHFKRLGQYLRVFAFLGMIAYVPVGLGFDFDQPHTRGELFKAARDCYAKEKYAELAHILWLLSNQEGVVGTTQAKEEEYALFAARYGELAAARKLGLTEDAATKVKFLAPVVWRNNNGTETTQAVSEIQALCTDQETLKRAYVEGDLLLANKNKCLGALVKVAEVITNSSEQREAKKHALKLEKYLNNIQLPGEFICHNIHPIPEKARGFLHRAKKTALEAGQWIYDRKTGFATTLAAVLGAGWLIDHNAHRQGVPQQELRIQQELQQIQQAIGQGAGNEPALREQMRHLRQQLDDISQQQAQARQGGRRAHERGGIGSPDEQSPRSSLQRALLSPAGNHNRRLGHRRTFTSSPLVIHGSSGGLEAVLPIGSGPDESLREQAQAALRQASTSILAPGTAVGVPSQVLGSLMHPPSRPLPPPPPPPPPSEIRRGADVDRIMGSIGQLMDALQRPTQDDVNGTITTAVGAIRHELGMEGLVGESEDIEDAIIALFNVTFLREGESNPAPGLLPIERQGEERAEDTFIRTRGSLREERITLRHVETQRYTEHHTLPDWRSHLRHAETRAPLVFPMGVEGEEARRARIGLRPTGLRFSGPTSGPTATTTTISGEPLAHPIPLPPSRLATEEDEGESDGTPRPASLAQEQSEKGESGGSKGSSAAESGEKKT